MSVVNTIVVSIDGLVSNRNEHNDCILVIVLRSSPLFYREFILR